ncbi:MAG: sulfatase family protein [Candidatus Sumerlaeaceae bacterium]
MDRFRSLAAALMACGIALISTMANTATQRKPNIVFVLADDVGYGDLSCYGARLVATPSLDALARDGRLFTDAHSAASTCTPSRRALLTGVYSWRQKPGSAIMRGDAPLSITTDSMTLPSMLKRAGYATGVVGKWHLGLGGPDGADWNGDIKPGPLELGFEYAFIIPGTGDRVPCVYVENHRVVGLDPADPIQVSYNNKVGEEPTGRERPDLTTMKSVEGHDGTIINGIGRIGWMSGGRAARWKDEEMSDVITSQAVRFMEDNQARPFFLYFSTHNIHVPRVPHPRFRGRSQCGRRGDAIVELDDSVGRILDTLKRLKLEQNTLVIFTSDNGGTAADGYADDVASSHSFNGVLHGRKSSVWEGGHRVPFLARWPGTIPAGSECSELVTQLDMFRSFASMLELDVPAGVAPDSCDVSGALLGKPHSTAGRTTFIAHNGGTDGPFGVRHENWKLVQPGVGRQPAKRAMDNGTSGTKLFNLATDLGEERDLAGEQPAKVAEMLRLLEEERADP